MTEPPCPACAGKPVHRELSGNLCGIPFALRETCDACGGTGVKPPLTVGELLASITKLLGSGELTEHNGVELYEAQPDGFTLIEAVGAWRLPTADGDKLVLETARIWACSCGREGIVNAETRQCECGTPLTVDTQGRPL